MLATTCDGWHDQRRRGSPSNRRFPPSLLTVEVTGLYSNRQIAHLAARLLDVVLEMAIDPSSREYHAELWCPRRSSAGVQVGGAITLSCRETSETDVSRHRRRQVRF